jgi:hypothetical protein
MTFLGPACAPSSCMIGILGVTFGALVATFPNSGFMGAPLVALLGPQAAAPAIVTLAVDMVVTSSLRIALSRLGSAETHGARRAVAHALAGWSPTRCPGRSPPAAPQRRRSAQTLASMPMPRLPRPPLEWTDPGDDLRGPHAAPPGSSVRWPPPLRPAPACSTFTG